MDPKQRKKELAKQLALHLEACALTLGVISIIDHRTDFFIVSVAAAAIAFLISLREVRTP